MQIMTFSVNELHEEDSKGCDRAKEAFSCLIKTGPKVS